MSKRRRKEIAAELRHVCPPPMGWRVIVRGSDKLPDGEYGNVRRFEKSRTYVIEVANDVGGQALEDTLIHEWAHMMSSGTQHEYHPLSGDHDAIWGIWYARVYAAFNGVK